MAGLTITAQTTGLSGFTNPIGFAWNSGVITSCLLTNGLPTKGGKFWRQYGYFEGVFQVPRGGPVNTIGYWPAFVLYPFSGGGEIDIFEIHGASTNIVRQSIHNGQGTSHEYDYTSPTDIAVGFHRIACDFQSDFITFYVDGVQTARQATTSDMTAGQGWYINIPLSVGGTASWPGAPQLSTANANTSGTLTILYVGCWANHAAAYPNGDSSTATPATSVALFYDDFSTLDISFAGSSSQWIDTFGFGGNAEYTLGLTSTGAAGNTFEVEYMCDIGVSAGNPNSTGYQPFRALGAVPGALTFSDNFATFNIHQAWQAGDNWQMIAPGTPNGRGGPNFGEFGDQWWVDPFNPNTPAPGMYTTDGSGLKLGLKATPSGIQSYINTQAGATLPYIGCIINTSQTSYQKFGYWSITVSVPKIPGFSFQADIENVQITNTWPPEIDLRITTNSAGVQTVLFEVATSPANNGTYVTYTTSSANGFDASASHTYSWSWQSDNIIFYIDGVSVYQTATPVNENYTTNPMFLFILTGANYIGNGDPATSALPAFAHISNVSVYSSTPGSTTTGTPPPPPPGTRVWYLQPGGDRSLMTTPFQTTATWITSGTLINQLRSLTNGQVIRLSSSGQSYSPPLWISTSTNDVLCTIHDSTGTIPDFKMRVPSGAYTENSPSGAGDNACGFIDTSIPYMLVTMNNCLIGSSTTNGSASNKVSTTNNVITAGIGMLISDCTGPIMMDAITGATTSSIYQTSDNVSGKFTYYDLQQLVADPNYVVQHSIALTLGNDAFGNTGIWPFVIFDVNGTGSIPEGVMVGIPASTTRPTGKTRGFYAMFDMFQHFGGIFNNKTQAGEMNFDVQDDASDVSSLCTDMQAQFSSIVPYLCILNYTSGTAGAQYGLSTLKGRLASATAWSDAFPAPPMLDYSPTNGVPVEPKTFRAWQASNGRGQIYDVIWANTVSGTPATASPNNTIVKAGSSALITDSSGNTWGINGNGLVTKNGSPDTTTSNVIELAYVSGVVWQENTSNNWYDYVNGAWAGPLPSPLPSASVSGSSITAPTTSVLTDSSFNLWGISTAGVLTENGNTVVTPGSTAAPVVLTPGSSATVTDSAGNKWGLTAAGLVTENGANAPGGNGTGAVTVFNGKMYAQDKASGNWYNWNGTTFVPAAAAPPTTGTTLAVIQAAYVNSLIWEKDANNNWYSTPTTGTVTWTGPTTTSPLTTVPGGISYILPMKQAGLRVITYIRQETPASFTTGLTSLRHEQSTNKDIFMYEGCQDPDTATFTGTPETLSAAASFQQTVWAAGQSDSLPVVQTSFGTAANYGTTGNLAAFATYGNAQTYTGTLNCAPNDGTAPGFLSTLNADALLTSPGLPVVHSEFGWRSDHNSASAVAAYVLDFIMSAYFDYNAPYYIVNGLYDDATGNWGLFNSDQTPRLVATALTNFFTLLKDTGSSALSFGPGRLNVSFSNMPTGTNPNMGGHFGVLQKSNGEFWILLRNEQTLTTSDANNHTAVSVANISTTMTLGTIATSIAVYDVTTGTTATQTANNTSSIVISLPPYPLLIRVIRP